MSKHNVELTLVEMFAIKHALEKQVVEKRKTIGEEFHKECTDWPLLEKLSKDVDHEDFLIGMFENEIREYRQAKRIY